MFFYETIIKNNDKLIKISKTIIKFSNTKINWGRRLWDIFGCFKVIDFVENLF